MREELALAAVRVVLTAIEEGPGDVTKPSLHLPYWSVHLICRKCKSVAPPLAHHSDNSEIQSTGSVKYAIAVSKMYSFL